MDEIMEQTFDFTTEQKANLHKWKDLLRTEPAQVWHVENMEAIESIQSILKEAGFEGGNDLTEDQLSRIFHEMRILVNNRTLARNLYEDNGLSTFNFALRKLLFASEPLVERINQFLKLRRVGLVTVSHFPCALSPREHPLVTYQTREVLELDANQEDIAYRQALRENNISSPENYYDNTIDYLACVIIYREVKNLLGIELYTDINNILWLARREVGGEEKPFITSVSLEKDLRDHIANNPSIVEEGLKFVKKEYPTPAGNIDVLCQGKKGKYVAIEVKKGGDSDKVVGQILRYIGGLQSQGKSARGIIILNEPDERINYALMPISDLVKVKYYKVSFEVSDTFET